MCGLVYVWSVVQSLGIRCRSSLRTRGVSVWVGVRVGRGTEPRYKM